MRPCWAARRLCPVFWQSWMPAMRTTRSWRRRSIILIPTFRTVIPILSAIKRTVTFRFMEMLPILMTAGMPLRGVSVWTSPICSVRIPSISTNLCGRSVSAGIWHRRNLWETWTGWTSFPSVLPKESTVTLQNKADLIWSYILPESIPGPVNIPVPYPVLQTPVYAGKEPTRPIWVSTSASLTTVWEDRSTIMRKILRICWGRSLQTRLPVGVLWRWTMPRCTTTVMRLYWTVWIYRQETSVGQRILISVTIKTGSQNWKTVLTPFPVISAVRIREKGWQWELYSVYVGPDWTRVEILRLIKRTERSWNRLRIWRSRIWYAPEQVYLPILHLCRICWLIKVSIFLLCFCITVDMWWGMSCLNTSRRQPEQRMWTGVSGITGNLRKIPTIPIKLRPLWEMPVPTIPICGMLPINTSKKRIT